MRELALVQDVAHRRVHPALGRVADAGLAPDFAKVPALVDEELRHAVVVGDEEVRVAGAAQVRGDGGQRPAPRRDAGLGAHFLEPSAAEVAIEILAPAVVRVLEALRHDLRVGELPEVEALGEVAAHEEIEPAVLVVVEPDRRVDVGPRRQAGGLGDAREGRAGVVVEQLGPAPAVQQQVVVAVVVVVAPHGAHRHAGLGPVQVRQAQPFGNLLERPVAAIAIEPVERPFLAVDDVEIVVAVGIDVHDRHRRAHRGHLRHDVVQLRIQRRAFVLEIDAGAFGHLGELEAVAGERIAVGRGHRRARPEVADQERRGEQDHEDDARSGLA